MWCKIQKVYINQTANLGISFFVLAQLASEQIWPNSRTGLLRDHPVFYCKPQSCPQCVGCGGICNTSRANLSNSSGYWYKDLNSVRPGLEKEGNFRIQLLWFSYPFQKQLQSGEKNGADIGIEKDTTCAFPVIYFPLQGPGLWLPVLGFCQTPWSKAVLKTVLVGSYDNRRVRTLLNERS